LPTTCGTFARGLLLLHTRGNLSAIPLKKVKFKNKNQKAINSYKTFRGSSPNKALSIHTTNSPSQSRETVPLTEPPNQIRLAQRWPSRQEKLD
jgi:hypothetical protein